MKIICKILAFGTIALSVGGCDLTMLPEHELSPEQYFQNESDLTLWSNQFWQLYGYTIPSFITYDFMDDVWSEQNPGGYFPRLRPIQS